mmetsp:Transcript_5654/g.17800  ORF Transcript_5654/g.17800 Transcript_5654/m.17800 type:complete len:293 (+) Transcript_5654:97-975(+)
MPTTMEPADSSAPRAIVRVLAVSMSGGGGNTGVSERVRSTVRSGTKALTSHVRSDAEASTEYSVRHVRLIAMLATTVSCPYSRTAGVVLSRLPPPLPEGFTATMSPLLVPANAQGQRASTHVQGPATEGLTRTRLVAFGTRCVELLVTSPPASRLATGAGGLSLRTAAPAVSMSRKASPNATARNDGSSRRIAPRGSAAASGGSSNGRGGRGAKQQVFLVKTESALGMSFSPRRNAIGMDVAASPAGGYAGHGFVGCAVSRGGCTGAGSGQCTMPAAKRFFSGTLSSVSSKV